MNEPISKRNISEEYIARVWDLLVSIEKGLISSNTGFTNLEEYIVQYIPVNSSKDYMIRLKIKNLGIVLSLFKILVGNIKGFVKKEKYEEFSSRINALDNLYNLPQTDKKAPFAYLFSEVKREGWYELRIGFDIITRELYKLREQVVSELSHILIASPTKTGITQR